MDARLPLDPLTAFLLLTPFAVLLRLAGKAGDLHAWRCIRPGVQGLAIVRHGLRQRG